MRVAGAAAGLAMILCCACAADAPPACPPTGCDAVDGSPAGQTDGAPGATSITHVEVDTPDRLPTGDCGAPGATDRSYTRYWQDDFTRSAGLPDAYFAVATEPYRINQEQQLYVTGGLLVDDEGLHLTARRVAPIVAGDGLTYHYTSGEVFTANRADEHGAGFGAYGRWEVCAR
ncbi:MAG TPA: hypothetical protein VMZ28_04870, partial [Kofleriaceae bacterium]|nr:hypothetical protein [Kofleriaceae bacterium]